MALYITVSKTYCHIQNKREASEIINRVYHLYLTNLMMENYVESVINENCSSL